MFKYASIHSYQYAVSAHPFFCMWMLGKSYLDVITDGGLAVSDSDYYKAKLTEMIATEEVKEDVLDEILQLPDAKRPQEQFYLTVRDHLLKHIRSHCPINLLKPRKHKEIRHLFDSVSEKLSKEVKYCKVLSGQYRKVYITLLMVLYSTIQTTLELLSALLIAEMKQTFYRLQVHAGTSKCLLQLKYIKLCLHTLYITANFSPFDSSSAKGCMGIF